MPVSRADDPQSHGPLRVCHVTALDTSIVFLMLPFMRMQRDAGFRVSAIAGVDTGNEPDPRIVEAGFTFHQVSVTRTLLTVRHFRSIADYVRLFRRERFDIVHVHTPIAALLARVAAAIARTPHVVYTAHGLYFQDDTPQPVRSVAIAAEWFAGRFTDLLMSQSSEDAATAERLRLSRGPIVAIGNGVDPNLFCPDEESRVRVRSRLSVPEDRPVILIVGRLVEEKGYLELLDAFRALRSDAELWIIGLSLTNRSGRGVRQRINDEIESPDSDRTIRYLGESDSVPEYMRAADIFVLPSHREGMPRSIIEAMMTALPVVASNIRGSREEVVHGETGLLFDVGDADALRAALQTLVDSPELRTQMGAAGVDRARRLYDESECLARQMNAIDAMLHGS